MFFEVFSFSGLQVEPRVCKRSDVRQKCFDEGMKFILKKLQRRVNVTETINKKPPETGLSREALRVAGTVTIRKVLIHFTGCRTRTLHRQAPTPPPPHPRFTSHRPKTSTPTPQKRGPTSNKHPGGDGAMMGSLPQSPNLFKQEGRRS